MRVQKICDCDVWNTSSSLKIRVGSIRGGQKKKYTIWKKNFSFLKFQIKITTRIERRSRYIRERRQSAWLWRGLDRQNEKSEKKRKIKRARIRLTPPSTVHPTTTWILPGPDDRRRRSSVTPSGAHDGGGGGGGGRGGRGGAASVIRARNSQSAAAALPIQTGCYNIVVRERVSYTIFIVYDASRHAVWLTGRHRRDLSLLHPHTRTTTNNTRT